MNCTPLHAWKQSDIFGVCGCLRSVFARGLYLRRGTFAQATFPSPAGVAHVECVAQWVADGSAARGITCPWHRSCSLQTRPKHVSVQVGVKCYMTGGFLKMIHGKMHRRWWDSCIGLWVKYQHSQEYHGGIGSSESFKSLFLNLFIPSD